MSRAIAEGHRAYYLNGICPYPIGTRENRDWWACYGEQRNLEITEREKLRKLPRVLNRPDRAGLWLDLDSMQVVKVCRYWKPGEETLALEGGRPIPDGRYLGELEEIRRAV